MAEIYLHFSRSENYHSRLARLSFGVSRLSFRRRRINIRLFNLAHINGVIIFRGIARGVNFFVEEVFFLDKVGIHLSANKDDICLLECGNAVEVGVVESRFCGFVKILAAHSAEDLAELRAAADQLALSLNGTIHWDKPLREAQYG